MSYPRVSQTSVLGLDAIDMPGKLREIQVWEPNVRPTRSEFSISKKPTSSSKRQPDEEILFNPPPSLHRHVSQGLNRLNAQCVCISFCAAKL